MAASTGTGPLKNVIVVGAGPAGLLLALLLARKGVSVQVVEAALGIDGRPRATHYGPPAIYELNRAGIADETRKQGFTPRSVCWRKLDGTFLGGLNGSVLDGDPDRLICLPLEKFGVIIEKHLRAQPSATISFQHKVVSIGQDEHKAWVDVETPEGPKTLTAGYIVGCDGANSQIRRSLFGDMNFPGRTWDEQIVATNTYYDFAKFGYEDANFIIDPEHWYMAARISNDGLWRVSYGEIPGLSPEELRERQPMKFEKMLPGHPKPDEYKLANFSPYKIHQRLAEKMRVGRFLLAADAAHLCNPFGGLGLTGGIVDVGGLYDCLIGIFEGKADESILDKYDIIRREKYSQIVDPISSNNIRLLFSQDPETALQDSVFLQQCKKTETDPEFSKAFQLGINELRHDFTQYYRDINGNINK